MLICIGIRFDNSPILHDVAVPPAIPPVGTQCVVRTWRGQEIGVVRTIPRQRPSLDGRYVRSATPEDVARHAALKERAEELKWLLKARVREWDLGVKIVALEFTLDESRLTVRCAAEDQVPLHSVAQFLEAYTKADIDTSTLGVREVARLFGACVTESCSSTWAHTFPKVYLRMARDQQLLLNPEKLNGPCGRLKCSLGFEHGMYRELLKGMPKKGAKVCHKSGIWGRVTKLHPLTNSVELKIDSGGVQTFPADEVT